jgi:hypothetical protein
MMMNAVAVGGTSLVNSALMQRPAGAFFEALPAELTASELEPRYQAIEAALSIAPGPADEADRQVLAASPGRAMLLPKPARPGALPSIPRISPLTASAR